MVCNACIIHPTYQRQAVILRTNAESRDAGHNLLFSGDETITRVVQWRGFNNTAT